MEISPERGFIFGQIREHVFDFEETESYLMSRLDWDIDPMPFCGIKIGLDIFKHLEINADGRIGYTGRCGQMQDYDWTGIDKTKNTHYSWHENYLKNYSVFSAQIGLKFNLNKNSAIMPFFSAREEDFDFAGYNGYSQYASANHVKYWDKDLPKKAMSGKVISYRQTRLFENAGFAVLLSPNDKLAFSYSTAFGFRSIIIGHDFHYKREEEFQDVIYGKGLCDFLFDLGLTYKIDKHNEVCIEMEIQDVPVSSGDTYQKKFDSDWINGEIFQNGGGASSTVFSFGVNYTLRF